MINFQEVTELLGKRLCDMTVTGFLNRLGEVPLITDSGETYWFCKNGLRFHTGPQTEIYLLFIYCRVPESWLSVHAGMLPFSGELPWRINFFDTPDVVRDKIGHNPKSTYCEKRPRQPKAQSEEEIESEVKDLVTYRATGEIPDGDLRGYLEERNNEPDNWFAEVYDIGSCEIDFCFLISDRQLIGIQLQ
jgi:hypothetical protein